MSVPADITQIHTAPTPPGGDLELLGAGAVPLAPPSPPPWPADLAKPPGARYIVKEGIWRIQRGGKFVCSSPDPYHLAEMWAAYEAGEADHEATWPATLGSLPTGADRVCGVWRVRRKKQTLAFARRPEDLLARLRASGAPVFIAPKIVRPRGRPPSPLSFKPTGRIPTFDGIEVFFKRSPTPTLAPSELAARLGIKVIELRDVELPHVGGRFNWREVCRCLRELAALGRAPRWYEQPE